MTTPSAFPPPTHKGHRSGAVLQGRRHPSCPTLQPRIKKTRAVASRRLCCRERCDGSLRQEDEGDEAAIPLWRRGTGVEKTRMISPGSDRWSKEMRNLDLKRDCEKRLGWATPSLRLRWAGQRRQTTARIYSRNRCRRRDSASIGISW
jgi:hypothetical protein